jgi:hypothetical protein
MVGNQHADALGGELRHDVHIDDRKRIDARKRLVEAQNGRFSASARYFDAAALATRKRHPHALADVRNAQLTEDLFKTLLAGRFVEMTSLEDRPTLSSTESWWRPPGAGSRCRPVHAGALQGG